MSIPRDRDASGIPLVCSKCNETFESDTDYLAHFKEHNRSDE
jgi:hypothetical protein